MGCMTEVLAASNSNFRFRDYNNRQMEDLNQSLLAVLGAWAMAGAGVNHLGLFLGFGLPGWFPSAEQDDQDG